MAHVMVDVETGAYLKAFDPDFHPDPTSPWTGLAEWTDDLAEALYFEDAGAAMDLWRTQSNVVPIRPDGKPNRPLSRFTVMIEEWRLSDGGG